LAIAILRKKGKIFEQQNAKKIDIMTSCCFQSKIEELYG